MSDLACVDGCLCHLQADWARQTFLLLLDWLGQKIHHLTCLLLTPDQFHLFFFQSNWRWLQFPAHGHLVLPLPLALWVAVGYIISFVSNDDRFSNTANGWMRLMRLLRESLLKGPLKGLIVWVAWDEGVDHVMKNLRSGMNLVIRKLVTRNIMTDSMWLDLLRLNAEDSRLLQREGLLRVLMMFFIMEKDWFSGK